jgi:hypothetical protein
MHLHAKNKSIGGEKTGLHFLSYMYIDDEEQFLYQTGYGI